MPSRPLTAADLGINEKSVERLAGRIMIQGRRMTVRIETILILKGMRGRRSVSAMMDRLVALARDGGMTTLVIEGVGVGNPRLARVLIERHGAVYTPQRTLSITIPL